MSYKWCAVPKCTSTTIKTPQKIFICVPKNIKKRRKWLELSRRNSDEIKPSSNIFFCEDHFNLQEDMANYYQYTMGLSQRIIMVDKVLPSKFSCQLDCNKRNIDSGTSTDRSVKMQKIDVPEYDNTLQEPTMEKKISCDIIDATLSNEDTSSVSEGCTMKSLKFCDKGTSTETFIVTAEKSIQCSFINKVHVKNMAVQTKIVTNETAMSPIKSAVSRCTSP